MKSRVSESFSPAKWSKNLQCEGRPQHAELMVFCDNFLFFYSQMFPVGDNNAYAEGEMITLWVYRQVLLYVDEWIGLPHSPHGSRRQESSRWLHFQLRTRRSTNGRSNIIKGKAMKVLCSGMYRAQFNKKQGKNVRQGSYSALLIMSMDVWNRRKWRLSTFHPPVHPPLGEPSVLRVDKLLGHVASGI